MSMEEPLMGNPATGTLQTDRSDLGTSQTSANSYPHKTAMVGGRTNTMGFFQRHRNIALYVPNIVGYLRVVCSAAAVALAFTRPKAMLAFYFVSFVFDELDGRFARLFSQQSTFGAVLDMVTDRLSTAALLCILGVLYPGMAQFCILLQALDIASHWCHMYASLVSGGTSHKELSNHHNWLVRSYYANRIFMGTCCVSCELMYLSLYGLAWLDQFEGWAISSGWLRRFFSFYLKQQNEEVPVFMLFAAIAVPGFIIKNVINVIQLYQSMMGLCRHDLKNM